MYRMNKKSCIKASALTLFCVCFFQASVVDATFKQCQEFLSSVAHPTSAYPQLGKSSVPVCDRNLQNNRLGETGSIDDNIPRTDTPSTLGTTLQAALDEGTSAIGHLAEARHEDAVVLEETRNRVRTHLEAVRVIAQTLEQKLVGTDRHHIYTALVQELYDFVVDGTRLLNGGIFLDNRERQEREDSIAEIYRQMESGTIKPKDGRAQIKQIRNEMTSDATKEKLIGLLARLQQRLAYTLNVVKELVLDDIINYSIEDRVNGNVVSPNGQAAMDAIDDLTQPEIIGTDAQHVDAVTERVEAERREAQRVRDRGVGKDRAATYAQYGRAVCVVVNKIEKKINEVLHMNGLVKLAVAKTAGLAGDTCGQIVYAILNHAPLLIATSVATWWMGPIALAVGAATLGAGSAGDYLNAFSDRLAGESAETDLVAAS